jgi:hypothetical protein
VWLNELISPAEHASERLAYALKQEFCLISGINQMNKWNWCCLTIVTVFQLFPFSLNLWATFHLSDLTVFNLKLRSV